MKKKKTNIPFDYGITQRYEIDENFYYHIEAQKLRDVFEERRNDAIKQIESLGIEKETKVLNAVLNLLDELEREKDENLRLMDKLKNLESDSEQLLIKTNPNEYGNPETVFENKTLFPATLSIWQSVKRGFDSRNDLFKRYDITELSLKKDNQLSQKEALLIAITKYQTNSLMVKYFPLIEINGFENERIERLFESFKEWLKLKRKKGKSKRKG